MKLRYLSIALGLTLPGCSLIPDYHRPEAPVQVDWPEGPAYAKDQAQGGQETTLSWQTFFRDPAMRQLIGVALEHNRDLRQAALNVEAYRALHRIERSALFPTIDANAGGTRQRVPDDLSTTGDTEIQSQYSATLGIAYEVDMFGRLRSLERAALQQYLVTAETQRAVQLALVGDVAIAYLTWRSDQAQLELASSTLQSYQYSLNLIRSSREVGTASALDVRQARSLVESARVQKALYTRQVAQDVNALQLLLGTNLPGDLPPAIPWNNHWQRCLRACRPTCCCVGRTSARPNTDCWRPMPTSARHVRRSSPASPSPRRPVPPAAISTACSRVARESGASCRR